MEGKFRKNVILIFEDDIKQITSRKSLYGFSENVIELFRVSSNITYMKSNRINNQRWR